MTDLHTYSYIIVDTQRGCHSLKLLERLLWVRFHLTLNLTWYRTFRNISRIHLYEYHFTHFSVAIDRIISGIDWSERRLISKLYVDYIVKVRLARGETRIVQIGTRMLFVTNSVQLVQQIPCQGSSGWAWRLQHRRANYSNCEICRWPCTNS